MEVRSCGISSQERVLTCSSDGVALANAFRKRFAVCEALRPAATLLHLVVAPFF